MTRPEHSPDAAYAAGPPRDPLPIVLIGAGGIARDAHLPAYRKAGLPVAAVVDLDSARARDLALLQRDPDIQGIIAGNDTMALGAVAAVEAAGLTGKVVIAGFDGSPDAVEAIKAGTLLATGLQPAVLISQLAVQQADAFVKTGETGEDEKQSIDCIVINAENAESYTLFALE